MIANFIDNRASSTLKHAAKHSAPRARHSTCIASQLGTASVLPQGKFNMQLHCQPRLGQSPRLASVQARCLAGAPAITAGHRPQLCAGQRLAERPGRAHRAISCQAATAEAPRDDAFDPQVCVVLGTQWGDEGKGKLVDILAQQYEIVARAQVRQHPRDACRAERHRRVAPPPSKAHRRPRAPSPPLACRAAPTPGTRSMTRRATSTSCTSSPRAS